MTATPTATSEQSADQDAGLLAFEAFDTLYRALTGHDGACRWQHRLFTDLEAGRFPTDVELATGIGKTSIIALWVLALGRALARQSTAVPRRLAYVVDRRVVVDEASEFAEGVRKRLELAAEDEGHALHEIATTLKDAGCTSSVVEVSTLRGQRALDTRWRDDPTRPAIIVGTVDMIGSRLLFSAYGRVGPWGRALEAGLTGQDCLLVLDEAHLCAPFATTLTAIERRVGTLAPFAVVRMGATMEPVRDLLRRTPGLPEEPTTRRVFQLLDVDTVIDGHTWPKETDDEKVSKRLNAKKKIEVEALDPDKGVGAQLAAWAIAKSKADPGAVIGIVVNTVPEVRKCAAALRAGGVPDGQVVTLTGSMRGYDRDTVVESDKYARFKSQRDRTVVFDAPIFLVATSCVEVGADIDCDHLGVEACAADSLIQRLGRVNRLGLSIREVTVRVVGNEDANGPAGKVFERLQALVADGKELLGSPGTFPACLQDGLSDEEKRGLFDVRVPPPALTNAVLDDLAMTSEHPNAGARPDVGRWLHGSVEDSSLYVELAWRAELDRVTKPDDAERIVAAFPIGARETARCPLYEAVELLKAVRGRAVEDDALGARFLLITRYGETKPFRLRELPTDDDSKLRAALHDATVVLPTSAGGYDGQFVNPATTQPVSDIAEQAQPTSRAQRRRLWIDSGKVTTASANDGEPQQIESDTDAEDLLSEVRGVADKLLGGGWRLVESAGSGTRGVVVARKDGRALEDAEHDDGSLGFQKDVLLTQHLGDARTRATELCRRLSLPTVLRDTVIEAAGQHDLGKDRPWWQRAVGRIEKPAVAKSDRSRFDYQINRGYRHELGSVADLGDGKVSLPDVVDRELCLHLVAAHHGHARPGFPGEAIGLVATDGARRVLSETPVRFAKLQAQYGWWSLAWLEALVKAADVLASRDEEESP
ncbi:type I-G CRISPR-associated helicase/endonuclease Cas3g [Sinimarinibacterium thermocellulolyticum]|uniref:Type I-U CRISPR-associated helicase/endonuclease Cas3 n=1 Tax=Sinimarinibacterium thermocellulolyticum TaxID=3170016 RepID=A0ABV2ADG4_9GAMM